MTIRMVYFAWVRERIGTGEESVAPPASVVTVADLVGWLAETSEPHAHAFEDRARLRAAVDQEFVSLDTPIGRAQEIAIFPPVTGG
ncbi:MULTISPECIES: molybdopterin converting factor subunit 1 [unclassified Sphingomonas]|jgi:molybdopterin synthase sulfur carrier subunit|uniref:molybdopterin converting factor subunit 1 n=1 Tax=unclassified Sphingomonas TaxID=196159 RepID=UPI0006FF9858|nr:MULTISPECIES: molybdopterin converting factor subunit 1 [unclassified Sphingomonas]KQN27242.1 molybdopterin synthase sulfur carrier subunit [Sphingomonas sp. Leaf34]KQN30971.1 molybdopterin synthase sulfur carrier subunit [Sphingomonas sp. Leaf38]